MPESGPKFTWDPAKDRINLDKHGIGFEEAKTVFYDDHARIIGDPDHSKEEDRFVILGISHKFRVLMVCHCYREDDDLIRIISARKATANEVKNYKGIQK